MAKLIAVSDTKAYRVSKIQMDADSPVLISVRQMYKKKGQESWLPAKQGLTVDPQYLPRLIKALEAMESESKVEILK